MNWVAPVCLVVGFGTGMVYGIYVHKYEAFPCRLLKRIFHAIHKNGPWSIGIYEGSHPFRLTSPPGLRNPVLTREDVTDLDAVYLADPFMVVDGGKHFLFFEVMDRRSRKGRIALADSTDGRSWHYRGVILEEPFHLSYPHVLKEKGEFYMVPESMEDLSVRLYRAVSFPYRWEWEKTLLTGWGFEDPTLFYSKGKWWMFVSVFEDQTLRLYFSPSLEGEWKEHPASPLARGRRGTRCAGKVFSCEGRLYRLVQDDYPDYGVQVFAMEILELSEDVYRERPALDGPVVTRSGKGWNARGMHHVDLHHLNSKWVAAVDGRRW